MVKIFNYFFENTKFYSTFAAPLTRKRHQNNIGLVVQLVRMPACHAGGRGFESRPDRFFLR